jgi:copper chaperone NosL
MKTSVLILIMAILVISCDKSRKTINYGEDQCEFCSMGIVQKTHAAQLVTSKGKQYKFDAIECMVNYIKDDSNTFEDANFFVANYNQPGDMIDAKTASFLISKNLPSPMGANLSAFASQKEAKMAKEKLNGELFSWSSLKNRINKNSHSHH